ncbi:capsule assembly Wzi family protein [Gammaproteobacteria bacterium]|nr:capsule assembly Wzi family protein [Gammaproteobacteria bacterium]
MHFRLSLKALFILFLPLLAFPDPWISGKEEFKVKKLEYLSIKNQFSIDTSAYPIPLALIRNPNEDMFNNMSLMNEYIDYANQIISKESQRYIHEFGFSFNSEFNPFRFIGSQFKDKNSFFFSSSYLGDRVAAKMTFTIFESPYEDKKYDFSDSYFAVVSGNFILGIGNYDRWWGPAHHGSLILSNYSKSSPGLFVRSLEGFSSSLPFFRSFGKVNFSLFANQLEKNRYVKNPFLIGTRISFNPVNGLTIGLTRSIMFGGDGKDNSLSSFWSSFIGDESRRHNTKDNNIDNELAGFDIKYSFNLENLVWSFYGQYIGEDGSDYWPWRTFYIAGSEFLFIKDGKLNSIIFEYFDTYYDGKGKGHKESEVRTNIIYEHEYYKNGYRYKGSPLGAFIDGDSNYYNFSINSQINDLTTIEFSLLYGNLNKDKSGIMNSWGIMNEDFFGIILNFDFKISEKIEAGINLMTLSEKITYRGKKLDENILGLDFKYRF